MFTSRKFYFILIFVLIFSIFLTFLPLLNGLGYEYSVISAIVLSFISVFLAAEYMNSSDPRAFIDFNVSDKLAYVILLSAVLVLINFLVGFFSSIIGNDCSINDGIKFYILITVISVFFATCLGLLTGTIFGKRGFFIGSIVLILTIVFSLWEWYHQLPLFLYSPVIGYFPGPLYDKVIPLTDTLIIYRLRVVVWALIFLNALHIIYGFRKNSFGTARLLSFVVLLLLLVASYYKQEDIGITHSREYIRDNFLSETFETDNFSIHYAPGTWEDKNIELIAKDHEWRYFQLEKYLDTDLDNKINVYIYPDKDTRKNFLVPMILLLLIQSIKKFI